ncbi:TPA: hypothetical protein ACX3ZT_001698 [Enterobacter cloacae]
MLLCSHSIAGKFPYTPKREPQMKVQDLSRAYSIWENIRELQKQRDLIAGGGGLGVTIQSTYQDASFEEAIRPHAVAELERRIEEQKKIISDLGVSFS